MSNTKKSLIVYTDGSCSGNGHKNAVGGIGIHFPNAELPDVSKVFRLGYCTNQRTELYAILSALRYIKQNLGLSKYRVLIKTDSQYSIDCVTKWVYAWIKNGWKTKADNPVANQEFIEKLHQYYEKYDIEFEHVDAHTNQSDDESMANARADELATKATEKAMREQKSNPKSNRTTNPIRKNQSQAKTKLDKQQKSGSKTAYYQSRPKQTRRRPNNRWNKQNPDEEIIIELVESS